MVFVMRVDERHVGVIYATTFPVFVITVVFNGEQHLLAGIGV